MTGVILRLRFDKGFGFIQGDDGTELFFHRSECDLANPFDTLKVGDHVTFKVKQHEKGKRATEVKLQ